VVWRGRRSEVLVWAVCVCWLQYMRCTVEKLILLAGHPSSTPSRVVSSVVSADCNIYRAALVM
jgi:hypothetical protein